MPSASVTRRPGSCRAGLPAPPSAPTLRSWGRQCHEPGGATPRPAPAAARRGSWADRLRTWRSR
eukprot:3113383-Pyramimonas_sp.AAC.1